MQAELEAETKRRLDERVERGEVLREPLVAVCAGPEDADDAVEGAKALRLAQLKAAGETREIHFDEPLVMMTGVPRPGRDDKYVRLDGEGRDRECKASFATRHHAYSACEPVPPPLPEPPPEPSVEAEWRPVWAQIAPPSDGNPGGAIVEGRYATSDDTVHVEDSEGRRLGSQVFSPGDNPAAVARKILREKGKQFYAPLAYPSPGLV
jgi:hypothetical protein